MGAEENLRSELIELKNEQGKLVNFINITLEKLSISKAKLSTSTAFFEANKKELPESFINIIKTEISSHASTVLEAQRLLSELSAVIKNIDDQLLFICE